MFTGRHRHIGARAAAALAGLTAVAGLAGTPAAVASHRVLAHSAIRAVAPVKPFDTATLEGCETASLQAERAATFTGEMTAVPGTTRMLMRIDVLERSAEETAFRSIAYPGLDDWLHASPGVKTYKNLDRVTDLAAPAEYRASIRFRWLGAHGRLLKSAEERTPVCTQPLGPQSEEHTSTAPSPASTT